MMCFALYLTGLYQLYTSCHVSMAFVKGRTQFKEETINENELACYKKTADHSRIYA
jgi:hypothetical protein